MLSRLEVHASIPAKDFNRAKKFYSEKLSFDLSEESPGGIMIRCKNSWFLLYPSEFAGTAQHTLAGWQTDNIEKEVANLKSRGIKFEEYDYPDFKTVGSIATTGPTKAAWFKDSEGNILGIVQLG
jgi:predicted enzyme related to lactoylglutathione lyase